MDRLATFRVREAEEEDVAAINAIYNHYVLTSDCTMETEPVTAARRREWLHSQGRRSLPVLVALHAQEILGWGALVPYAERVGYRFTLEDSVYVRDDARGRGIGRILLASLVSRASGLGAHSIIGKISASQESSVVLHRRFGFEEVGRLREVGFKFDRWIDVLFLQRRL